MDHGLFHGEKYLSLIPGELSMIGRPVVVIGHEQIGGLAS